MYQTLDNAAVAISVNDWISLGFTQDQLKKDSSRGFLKIVHRSINGNTMIDVNSIKRPDRKRVIEAAFGRLDKPKKVIPTYSVEFDTQARDHYLTYCKVDGSPLDPDAIKEYTNLASVLNGLRRGLQIQQAARAKNGKRVPMGEFWQLALYWYLYQATGIQFDEEHPIKLDNISKDNAPYPCRLISNPRSLERLFKRFIKEGYDSLIHGNQGNDNSRKVSTSIENLFLALWRTYDKPFITTVHQRYLEFVSGSKEFHDKKTGEVFNPADFRHKGRAMEVTEATVWNYLKDEVNNTAVYTDRNGNFDYMNKKRPKHQRKLGAYSLSKISMDDVAMSRQSVRGWVYKYIAVDVLSGYWFRPAYVVGKPTANTVLESFRNMFCELAELNMPMPGELEVEYHLMQDISWLNELFPFVRFCESFTEKRAEHAIKAFKYGVSKKEGHTRGRWYAGHEAFRSVRNKVNGDYVIEGKQSDKVLNGTIRTNNFKADNLQPQTIVADDLADVIKHNNELHPLQKTYPGMTRRDVLMQRVNPNLKPVENRYLYKYIGNVTETSINNNDWCWINDERFEIADYTAINRLKPNNNTVTAYWMPEADGTLKTAYLYQGDTYLCEALNKSLNAYNEFAFERTEDDEAGMLHQQKRLAKFDKMIGDRRSDIPIIGSMDATEAKQLNEITTTIVPETAQPVGYETDELDYNDWAAKAVNAL
jgi:hypothetical protein